MNSTTEDTEDTETEGREEERKGLEGKEVEGGIGRIRGAVIGAAIEIHRELGPGLLESAYETCLAHQLNLMGHKVERQRAVPLVFQGVHLDCGYRLDLIVDDLVIVEVKAVEAIHPIHSAQLLSYLKLSGLPLGLLINFNVPLLKQGIRRLKSPPSASDSISSGSPSVSVSSVSSVVHSPSASVPAIHQQKEKDNVHHQREAEVHCQCTQRHRKTIR